MAVPKISPEDRAKALQKAQQVRKERASLREKMKTGAMTMKDVIDKKEDDIVGGMRVKYVLESLPGIGKVRAKELMDRIGIDENRKVKGLGSRQEAALLEHLK
ncbi:MAG: integration host factor, actinobacterial type [Bacillota bacterium]|nr:integration host factor, actinobacterial type [Bacillota bacterium]